MHFSADADHRRCRGSARELAGLGADVVCLFSRALCRRGTAGLRHRRGDWRRAVQRGCARPHRRRRVPRRREDVPMGFRATVRRRAGQGLGRRRAGRVGRRRRPERSPGAKPAKGGWHLSREGASHLRGGTGACSSGCRAGNSGATPNSTSSYSGSPANRRRSDGRFGAAGCDALARSESGPG